VQRQEYAPRPTGLEPSAKRKRRIAIALDSQMKDLNGLALVCQQVGKRRYAQRQDHDFTPALGPTRHMKERGVQPVHAADTLL
jgi:hypothetical protein